MRVLADGQLADERDGRVADGAAEHRVERGAPAARDAGRAEHVLEDHRPA